MPDEAALIKLQAGARGMQARRAHQKPPTTPATPKQSTTPPAPLRAQSIDEDALRKLQASARGMQLRRQSTQRGLTGDGYIRVCVRVRPLGEGRGERGKLSVAPKAGTIVTPEHGSFVFEKVHEQEDNEKLFEEMGMPLVSSVLSGYNSTLFAYGQTGSGKTYTIGEVAKLNTPHEGVAHRMVRALFKTPPADLGVTPTAWSVQCESYDQPASQKPLSIHLPMNLTPLSLEPSPLLLLLRPRLSAQTCRSTWRECTTYSATREVRHRRLLLRPHCS